jgi:hypothetical protein
MNQNPYTPPSSNLDVPDAKRGSAVKAVVVGLVADIGGSMLVGALASIGYVMYLGAMGTPQDQIAAALGTSFAYDSPLGIALTVIGCLFSVLGGYICARIAKHSEYRLGLIMFGVSLLFLVFIGNEESRAIVTAAMLLGTLASIMAGIHLGVRKNRSGR